MSESEGRTAKPSGLSAWLGWLAWMWQTLRCKHHWEWRRNVYGDEINHADGKRSEWMCVLCDRLVYRPELRLDLEEPVKVQACRPEDRAMLATPAGQELLRCAVAAMRDEKPNAQTQPTTERSEAERSGSAGVPCWA